MAGRRHDHGRLCLCDPTDRTCAGLAVRRLSRDRVRELAEEIWTASSGDVLPARPVLDPRSRSSRAGASAGAAYRRHRERERAGWRLGSVRWTAAVIGAAGSVGGLRGQARAVAETLRAADGVGVAAPGQLSGVVRSGPAATAEDLEQATTRLLEVLRPAA